ncbi:hypothetical protein HPP92_000847 [Vanilla planifolia]|uniref:Uncharacterized protein n=1 Tax=Vanilla planifolia TaxID=51239 RepID=A0A835RPW9_VANPL|nr:hypothetical protein HPP92_001001 [Vanilla planifolia]KAG0500775.1 hypothetical protein HPP92_000847 [Vanilla planifolia]
MEISAGMPSASSLPCQMRRTPSSHYGIGTVAKLHTSLHHRSFLRFSASKEKSSSVRGLGRCRSSLGSFFCYDKSIPEEVIEKPVGFALNRREIGSNPPCSQCDQTGIILCGTCSGSGLYVDSILESQGIIVKVRCLGCGGSGNIMCSNCGGRGHAGMN